MFNVYENEMTVNMTFVVLTSFLYTLANGLSAVLCGVRTHDLSHLKSRVSVQTTRLKSLNFFSFLECMITSFQNIGHGKINISAHALSPSLSLTHKHTPALSHPHTLTLTVSPFINLYYTWIAMNFKFQRNMARRASRTECCELYSSKVHQRWCSKLESHSKAVIIHLTCLRLEDPSPLR